ncbi:MULTISPECIES: YlbL family protein [Actinoplanes]|uniref:Lon proteolytic domain-containing protein n=2 Tax=Actinoplanes TaxID=1865 RepID=A0A101JME1_9ACTN|nr:MULTISPECIES: S16 family serine protease [Actinoplanes]KUL29563.1 hypothetical protein ADL15_27735 [Actinoplanes awajinensis subsp. mycoplanecinus]GIE65296.1 hypothetical protein Apa02nite_014040 [Actinoplanes palleronii]
MNRRGVAVIAGAVVTALLGAGAGLLPLPYVVLEPGPTIDVLGSKDGKQVITVTGTEASVSAGQLRMTTVEVQTDVGLGEAASSWFDDTRALVPRSVVFPPDKTTKQVDTQNAEQFTSSQTSAEKVALRELGYPPEKTAPFTVAIDLDKIGGPSAGLIFTLGIIDKLTPADLTGGRIIAGTGIIDDDGKVGPIGGIPQKLVGARSDGAELFLVPAANCAEASRNTVPGLTLAKVATVTDALTALRTYTTGGTPTPC